MSIDAIELFQSVKNNNIPLTIHLITIYVLKYFLINVQVLHKTIF